MTGKGRSLRRESLGLDNHSLVGAFTDFFFLVVGQHLLSDRNFFNIFHSAFSYYFSSSKKTT